MIKPLPLYIGLRYTRAKRRNRFISFISFASTLGIALGVAVLLTVVSVMNGFDEQIREHFFRLAPQVTISTEQDIDDWSALKQTLTQVKEVRGLAPFVSGEGMLVKANMLRGVNVVGILPDQEVLISQIKSETHSGDIQSLSPKSYHLLITQNLAEQMNLNLGDSVNVLTSQATTTPLGLFPRYRQFTVSGIYHNSGASWTQEAVYIAMDDAKRLFAAGTHLNGLHLKLDRLYQAPQVSAQLKKLLASNFNVSDWTEESGALFQALALEKTMMFIILLLIIAIAAFNLVSMLMMMVNEKRADIAILRTLGAPPAMVRNIFIIQGSILGFFGVVAGLGIGLLLTWHVTEVANFLQQLFHVQFIPTSAYWSNYLPAKILLPDIVIICAIALGLSILATFYPAMVAFRIQPAEALRYE
jgi:lipoprotein-releasing system permease protein